MKKFRFLTYSLIFITVILPINLLAENLNDLAYQNRYPLKAGTILNNEEQGDWKGIGDALLFPYYEVRELNGIKQRTIIKIKNISEYGVVARIRFRESAQGREVFSKDIWIPSSGLSDDVSWQAILELNEDGTNVVIKSFDPIIWRYDRNSFYLSNILPNGASFSTRYNKKNNGKSTCYGFIEVIGEEKTSPENIGGRVERLSKSERDCPNTLMGKAFIERVEEGAIATYDAIAIGNFSRGQGSLFRSTSSRYPDLTSCEDTLDQLEFQLSKWEIFGPYSLDPSQQGKTSLILTFPTKHFHYKLGRRINFLNNPFEALNEKDGETLKSAFFEEDYKLAESTITLPFSVNLIGFYKDYYGEPLGIDNISLQTYSSELGEASFISDNFARRILIPDYVFFQERFNFFRGLPLIGLVLQEYRNPALQVNITPIEFSVSWEPTEEEYVTTPTIPTGSQFGVVNKEQPQSYDFITGGSSSNHNHPIEYQFDWTGNGTDLSSWGAFIQSKTWTTGGIYNVKARARCAIHPEIVSEWSDGFPVTVESVSPPTMLSGPLLGVPGTGYIYFTSGATSNLGHPVQYFFDWGDGTDSGWLPSGINTATKVWSKGQEQKYPIKARARCTTHPLAISDWTPQLNISIEFISAPNKPTGTEKGQPGMSSTYMTGGAFSTIGDPIQYLFDWGDGTNSGWLPVGTTSASKTWTTGGDYKVKAKARCATHTTNESNWSEELTVSIEKISKPSKPTGGPSDGKGQPETLYTFNTGGAVSNIGDPVQYLFNWGDGSNSGWLPVGTTSASKSWYIGGTYHVKVKARCATHPSIESEWSEELIITIESISTPSTPSGPTIGNVGISYDFTTSGAVSNIGDSVEYQFDWGDGSTSSWGSGTQSKIWNDPDTYYVRARARCTTHTSVMSEWSGSLEVTISP